MQPLGALVRLTVAVVLFGGLCAACDPGPPEASPELAALEHYLLTADEVGDGFVVQESGAVRGAGVGHLCPDAGASFDMMIAVLEFPLQPPGDNIADGGLAGTHRADEDDVAMIHAAMITAKSKKAATGAAFFD